MTSIAVLEYRWKLAAFVAILSQKNNLISQRSIPVINITLVTSHDFPLDFIKSFFVNSLFERKFLYFYLQHGIIVSFFREWKSNKFLNSIDSFLLKFQFSTTITNINVAQ